MDTTETRREVDRILDADLGELTRTDDLSGHPLPQVMAWHLPEAGRIALRDHGLPPARTDGLLGVVGGFQESDQAGQGPDGRQLYLLGSYGTSRLAAMEGSGEAVAVPATSEVHPDLAHLHPFGIPTTVVNSTVVGLIECAWRWHAILPLLADEQERAGAAEIAAWRDGRISEEAIDPYAAYQDLCGQVLQRFRDIDPIVSSDSNFWVDVIVDVS